MPLVPPYKFIAEGLKAGEIVPFFGAAASAVYRPDGETWTQGKPFMPFGGELAATLATAASYPVSDSRYNSALSDIKESLVELAISLPEEKMEAALQPILRKYLGESPSLALIASWAEHVQGHRRAINRELRQSFAVKSTPGLLHRELAGINATQLYVTTNYDDILEIALKPRQPHTIVDRGDRGLWVTVAGQTAQRVAPTGSELYGLLNNPATGRPSGPIIFKMHGSVDQITSPNDAYLITEEDYVDFLGRAGGSYVPPYVSGLMEGKDLLFLGYSLEDWNVRVILRKLLRRGNEKKARRVEEKTDENKEVRFWAIVKGRSDEEQEVWQARNLNIYPMDVRTFAEKLKPFL